MNEKESSNPSSLLQSYMDKTAELAATNAVNKIRPEIHTIAKNEVKAHKLACDMPQMKDEIKEAINGYKTLQTILKWTAGIMTIVISSGIALWISRVYGG